MTAYDFVTLDVFTDTRFGGNPLAVFTDARGLSDADMQSLAKEFNLSETTFILPPENPAHAARVRIFNVTAEMPFAGHPSVGTGYVLAQMGRAKAGALTMEVPAGLVEVKIATDAAGAPTGGVIAAPRPLSTGETLAVDAAAACIGLTAADIVTANHSPIEASVGMPFFFVEVTPEALSRATPDLSAFRRVAAGRAEMIERLSIHLYTRDGEAIRARMFGPLSGVWEDPATGSANAALAALLTSLSGADEAAYAITQGVEMGRPSRLSATARKGPDGMRATIGGGCVPVLSGTATV